MGALCTCLRMCAHSTMPRCISRLVLVVHPLLTNSFHRARFCPLSSEGHGGGLPSYRLSWPFGVGVCMCGCASPPLLSNRFAEEGPPSPPPPLWFSRVRAMGARHPGRFACVWVGVCSKETTNAPFFSPFFGKIETPGLLQSFQ